MVWNRAAFAVRVVAGLLAGVLLAAWVSLTLAQDGDARVRVVHAGYDIGPVDVYINDDLAIEALVYADATGYLALAAGEYNVQVTAAGGDPADAVIDTSVTLEARTPHTLVAIGPPDLANLTVILDDDSMPGTGMVRLSLVNAASDAIVVGLNMADGTTLIDEVQVADASEYVDLDAGAYDLSVVAGDSGAEVASISGFNAEQGETYSLFMMGVAGEYEVVAFVDSVDEEHQHEATSTPAQASATATAASSTPVMAVTTPTAVAGTTATGTSSMPQSSPSASSAVPSAASATATVIPSLPTTGAGGADDGGNATTWLAGALLAVAMLGVALWRRPGRRT